MATDDRKVDDGTAGPRPHGLRPGEPVEGEEIDSRASFLRDRHLKVVAPPENTDKPEKAEKPKGTQGARRK